MGLETRDPMRADVQPNLNRPDCESKPGFGLCIRQVRCMYQAISIRASRRVEISHGRDHGFVYILGSGSLKEVRGRDLWFSRSVPLAVDKLNEWGSRAARVAGACFASKRHFTRRNV
ncbi:Glutamate decarboxylase [Fusarium oxysporum f. sp. albedinis]|nr:Glutamate decarboxylase [Fusarium oxysporum f. sp. albedinis]